MSGQLSFGHISFGGFKLFALPENYQVIVIGNKSKPISRAGGSIMDVGYGHYGFSVSSSVLDAYIAKDIHEYAKSQLEANTPITVVDTLYPGGKTWSGFFELPILSSGQVGTAGVMNLPINMLMNDLQLTFYSLEPEII